MKFLIVITPLLTAGLAARLYGWTLLDATGIAWRCILFTFFYLLALQGITAFLIGDKARAGYFHAGFSPFACGVVALTGMLIGYASNGAVVPTYQVLGVKGAFLVNSALLGIPTIAMLLWPFYTIAWIVRVFHWSEVEREMRGSQRRWDAAH